LNVTKAYQLPAIVTSVEARRFLISYFTKEKEKEKNAGILPRYISWY
jgi:hypothetical protein